MVKSRILAGYARRKTALPHQSSTSSAPVLSSVWWLMVALGVVLLCSTKIG